MLKLLTVSDSLYLTANSTSTTASMLNTTFTKNGD